MYNHIAGMLESKTSTEAVVDANGVGYLLRIRAGLAEQLPSVGQRVKLLAYLHVTEDAHTLYGFQTEAEREFFLQLLGVDRVGPKMAMTVLGGGKVEHIQQAIRMGDFKSISKIKGVGEATAKKIVLALGKILIHQPGTASDKPSRNAAAPLEPAVTGGLDEETDIAVKAVVQLQEVEQDVALQAVQRAFTELSANSKKRPAVQDVIQRAMKYTD